MHANFWHEKWEQNDIAFHEREANPLLVKYFDRLALPKGSRVFLPLCGKTLAIHWLLAKGYRVAGAELSESAVAQLFRELAIEPSITAIDEIRRYSAEHTLSVTGTGVADGSNRPVSATGQLTFIDNTVDSTTGTIKLKASFPNTDHSFWPGQFINVVMTLRTIDRATVVPSEAIQSGQKGQFAFVVKPDQTVETRQVTVGQTIDNQIVVQSGISPGETVVTDGQLRLFPGAHIRVVPAATSGAGAS